MGNKRSDPRGWQNFISSDQSWMKEREKKNSRFSYLLGILYHGMVQKRLNHIQKGFQFMTRHQQAACDWHTE